MKFSSSVNVAKPFDTYDEKKFRERFRLSKIVVKCLLDEVTMQLHSFIKLLLFHSLTSIGRAAN